MEIENTGEATIGGHLVELLGRVPEAGETVDLAGFAVRIDAVDEARIVELRVALPPSRSADD